MTVLDRKARICARATRIVERVYGPRAPARHGFYDPEGFWAACQRNGRRVAAHRFFRHRLYERAERQGKFA